MHPSPAAPRPLLRYGAALCLALAAALASAQTDPGTDPDPKPDEPAATKFKDPTNALWVNTYGNIRISDRWFWIAQTHFRFAGTDQTPLIGQIGQLYNRHALSYLVSKKFRPSLGGVLRLNFNPDRANPEGIGDARAMVPEYRIWHEYLFAAPVGRVYFYHRVRLEHRWTRGFTDDPADDWIFRNRWRYMASAKIPVNKHKLGPGAFYVGPEAELIMQSGKAVVGSPLEDLRLHTSFGYIATPRLTFAVGGMYSMGQTLSDASVFKQKYTLRAHCYFSPDWRKIKSKLPDIHRNE